MGSNYRTFEELEYPDTPEPDAQKIVRQGGKTYPRCGFDEIEASRQTDVDGCPRRSRTRAKSDLRKMSAVL